jgi:hypothetical protein
MAKTAKGRPGNPAHEWELLDQYLREVLPAALSERGMAGTAEVLRGLPKVTGPKAVIVALPMVASISLFAYDQAAEVLKKLEALEADRESD